MGPCDWTHEKSFQAYDEAKSQYVGNIHYVGVSTHARRRGIGGALTSLAVNQCKERANCIGVMLMSKPNAIHLHTRLGFVKTGETYYELEQMKLEFTARTR